MLPRRSTEGENEEKIVEQGRQEIFILPDFIKLAYDLKYLDYLFIILYL